VIKKVKRGKGLGYDQVKSDKVCVRWESYFDEHQYCDKALEGKTW